MNEPLRCVLDVSVSTKQFIDDPLSAKVDQLLDFLIYPQTEIFVPDLFYIESTNTLWKYVRAEILTPAEVQANLVSLKALSLQVVSTVELIEEAFPIAVNFGISARDNFKQVLLNKRLHKAIKASNLDENGKPWLEERQISSAIAQLERLGPAKLIEANQTVTDLLLTGTTVEGKDGKNTTIQYINFDRPDKNDFLVINQFRVDPLWSSGDRGYIIPDLVLFVNGIPLVVIECKSPKPQNPLTEAITDLLKYSNQRESEQPEGAEKLFYYNLLMVAASQHRAAAGAVGTSYEDYVEWKDAIQPNTGASDLQENVNAPLQGSRETLVAGMIHPINLLDILHNFTLFTTEGGRIKKITPYYQQYRAVHESLHRLQHSQTRSIKCQVN